LWPLDSAIDVLASIRGGSAIVSSPSRAGAFSRVVLVGRVQHRSVDAQHVSPVA
jgi:hypothetical protein